MSSRLTRVAGLILVVIALPIAFYGLASFLYAFVWVSAGPCAPTAPVCRSPGLGGLLIGAVVLAIAVTHFAVGIGLMLKRGRTMIAGLIVSIVGVIGTAYVALTAFEPMGYSVRDPAPSLQPDYNTTSIAIAVGLLPYSIAALILLLGLRQRSQAGPQSLSLPIEHATELAGEHDSPGRGGIDCPRHGPSRRGGPRRNGDLHRERTAGLLPTRRRDAGPAQR